MPKKTKQESIIETIEMVQMGVISAHQGFHDRDLSELMTICNGCGASGSKLPVPQTIYGMDTRPACNPHDQEYHDGTDIEEKRIADRRMLNNILRLIHIYSKNKFMVWLRTKRAIKYYMAVDLMGGPAFWDGKTK